MSNRDAENIGCLLVAEYVDHAGATTNSSIALGQDVGTNVVASYIDAGVVRDFTILLKSDRVVTVRGDGLRVLAPTAPGECGTYGIVAHAGGEEVLIALFSIPEVVGVFDGEIRPDRKIA